MYRREFLVGSGRTALGLSALCVSACASGTQRSAALRDAFLEDLVAGWETGIPQWLHESKMPAVSIAIIRDGRLASKLTFGVKDTGTNEPVDNDTLFAACSNTKPVFAYGVLKLCEKGLLNLDTPLTKYTRRRITEDPRIDLVTARHVLTHTTGFPNWRQGPDLPIEFTPGSKNQYSGEGFSYLQSVVEEVASQSFEAFMRDNVLMPLGMTSSRIISDLDYSKVAKPHDEHGKRIDVPLIVLRHGKAPPRPPQFTQELYEAYDRAWAELQEDLAKRSPRGEVRVAEESGHMIQIDQPELVAQAVRDVMQAR